MKTAGVFYLMATFTCLAGMLLMASIGQDGQALALACCLPIGLLGVVLNLR